MCFVISVINYSIFVYNVIKNIHNQKKHSKMIDFLKKLDNNLTISLQHFDTCNKTNVTDLNTLQTLIRSTNQKLFKYLENIRELERMHFSTYNEENENKFVLSFDIDSSLYDKNFKKLFKENIALDVNKHKIRKNIKPKQIEEVPEIKTITEIDGADITRNKISITVAKSLKDIKPMFYWYEGDATYKKGIYTCLSPGFYTKVPFPSTVSVINQNHKVNSIPCKFETREQCDEQKLKISKIYNSEIRVCTYVHKKEKFAKIGAFYRCNVERFGSHETLAADMNYINSTDIKRILMYSLSDSLLSVMWYQNKFKDGNLLLNNLDTF